MQQETTVPLAAPIRQSWHLRAAIKIFAATCLILLFAIGCLLFFPPARDQFFSNSLWPWSLPCDITPSQLQVVKSLSRPGDVIVESNVHYPQWVTFCQIGAGTSWVHTSLVDTDGYLISVGKVTWRMPLSDYLTYRSTRLAVIRPPYKSLGQIQTVLEAARAKIGVPYDPSFQDPTGNCTGLVGESLKRGGITTRQIVSFGHIVYPPSAFFEIAGAKVIWSSDRLANAR